jgi:hypothetical protein
MTLRRTNRFVYDAVRDWRFALDVDWPTSDSARRIIKSAVYWPVRLVVAESVTDAVDGTAWDSDLHVHLDKFLIECEEAG